ncbi:MAG: hypothetical protein GY849_05500 [Deltaproteobacteria bacterium]|nr:hypothetical protein [Deltaproteobacteria bacterium]
MDTETVRLNITIPKDLALALKRLTGPRKRSRFVAEALRERIEKQQKDELLKVLEEGYRAGANESLALSREFDAVDLEGWDAY